MVRKIGKFLLSGGCLVAAPLSILPLSNFRDKMVSPIREIFHGQMPQGCAYSQKFGLE